MSPKRLSVDWEGWTALSGSAPHAVKFKYLEAGPKENELAQFMIHDTKSAHQICVHH